MFFEIYSIGTSLVVRWLKFGAPNAEGTASIPSRGTKTSHAKAIKIKKKFIL